MSKVFDHRPSVQIQTISILLVIVRFRILLIVFDFVSDSCI